MTATQPAPDERTETVARLTEIVRVEMSKGAYQMLPDELPYESAARRVAAAVVAALDDETARLRAEVEQLTGCWGSAAERANRASARADAVGEALDRVRALHERVTRWGNEDYSISQDAYDDAEPEDLTSLTAFDVCAECFRIEQTSDQHDGDECTHAVLDGLWPCPTVRVGIAGLDPEEPR